MNRLQFFKWIGKGAAAAIALPLLPVLPKAKACLAIPGKPYVYSTVRVVLTEVMKDSAKESRKLDKAFDKLRKRRAIALDEKIMKMRKA